MKPTSSSRCRRQRRARPFVLALWAGLLLPGGTGLALAEPADPGRLFYTPSQRAQLEAARAQSPTPSSGRNRAVADEPAAPLRYDGVVIRSDGKSTRWVDGKPALDAAGVSGLKPGQVRAGGKVYEPYEVLRPQSPLPAASRKEESAP